MFVNNPKKENPLFVLNSTQVPHVILRYLMKKLPSSEYYVLLYITDKTYGWGKEFDKISLSQFENGTKRKDGSDADLGVPFSRPTIINALKNLVNSGLVIKLRSKNSYVYGLNFKVDMNKVVDKIVFDKEKRKKEKSFIRSQLRMGF